MLGGKNKRVTPWSARAHGDYERARALLFSRLPSVKFPSANRRVIKPRVERTTRQRAITNFTCLSIKITERIKIPLDETRV